MTIEPSSAGETATTDKDSLPTLLVLTSTYPRWQADPEPGFVHELSKRLTGAFQVIVLGPHAQGALPIETIEGVEVIRFRYAPQAWETLVNNGGIVTNLRRNKWKIMLLPTFILAQVWCAWRISRTRNISLVHAHWLIPQGLLATFLRSRRGERISFMVTSHGADLYALRGKLLNALKRFVIKRAAATTVVSEPMRDMLDALGVGEGVSVQPMGTDLAQRFTPGQNQERSSNEILFVGRFVEKKGLRHLIAAFPLILEKRPDCRLNIAGFGPEEHKLRRQVEQLALVDKVRFLGAIPQDRLPALYRDAAVFVAPFVEASSGDQEGLGLVLVEAIGCGCPVVAGGVPAVRNTFEAMGLRCVRADDKEQLAAAVIEILGDTEETATNAAHLREAVVRIFDWEHVANTYVDLLLACATHSGQDAVSPNGKLDI